MSVTLKIIKTKPFEANGESHTHYTCAYKGRVFGVSSLRFNEELSVKDDKLTISGDIEVLKRTSTDPLTGETKSFLDIVPASGLTLAEF